MTFQLKILSGSLDEEQKKFIRKRFLWLEEHLPKAAVTTIGIKEHINKRSNQAFEVFVHLQMPNFMRKPIYTHVAGDDFKVAVDKAKNRIERIVVKKKEKTRRFKFQIPKLSIRRKKLDEST